MNAAVAGKGKAADDTDGGGGGWDGVAEMDAETTAARGGSVRACDADDDSALAVVGAPAVVGRLLLDPGLPSRVAGTLKPKEVELAARERKDCELCGQVEADVGGARKDWLESRKEWLLAGRGCGWVPPPPPSALQSLYMRVSVPS